MTEPESENDNPVHNSGAVAALEGGSACAGGLGGSGRLARGATMNSREQNEANGFQTGFHKYRFFTVTGEDFARSIKWARSRKSQVSEQIEEAKKRLK